MKDKRLIYTFLENYIFNIGLFLTTTLEERSSFSEILYYILYYP